MKLSFPGFRINYAHLYLNIHYVQLKIRCFGTVLQPHILVEISHRLKVINHH